MKYLAFLIICGVAALAQTPPPAKAPAKTPAKTAAPGAPAKAAAPSNRPSAALMNPAALRARAPETFTVKFVTTHGDFTVEVHRAWSPLGADRFYNLVKNNFFTDAAFFRYVNNFIVQFGLPANPAIAKVWENARIKDDPHTQSNSKGTLVFATAGPNTRTTQFFINLKDNPGLDAQGFTPFGTVTEGMDVVAGLFSGYGESPSQERITAEGNAYLDKNFPKLDKIKSATVTSQSAPAPAAAAPKKAATPATPAKK